MSHARIIRLSVAIIVSVVAIVLLGCLGNRILTYGWMSSAHSTVLFGTADAVRDLPAVSFDTGLAWHRDWRMRGATPLMYASLRTLPGGQREFINAIPFSHVMIDQTDAGGRTALHYAVEHRRADIVKALLAADADWTIEDKAGHTPMHMAVLHDWPKALELLTEIESQPTSATTCLKDVEMFAVRFFPKSPCINVIRTLLELYDSK